jgi:hypothetical protein
MLQTLHDLRVWQNDSKDGSSFLLLQRLKYNNLLGLLTLLLALMFMPTPKSSQEQLAINLQRQKELIALIQSPNLTEARVLQLQAELTSLYEEQTLLLQATEGIEPCQIAEADFDPDSEKIQLFYQEAQNRLGQLCPGCTITVKGDRMIVEAHNSETLKQAEADWKKIAQKADALGVKWVQFGKEAEGFPTAIIDAYDDN